MIAINQLVIQKMSIFYHKEEQVNKKGTPNKKNSKELFDLHLQQMQDDDDNNNNKKVTSTSPIMFVGSS